MIVKPLLSLIIPIRNGQDFFEDTLKRLYALHGERNEQIEICIINDGSTDNTKKILEGIPPSFGIKVIAIEKNHGKGAAIRAGLEVATGEYLAFTDADLPYGLTIIDIMMNRMRAEPKLDLLYGSRAHHDSTVRRGYGFLRRIGRAFFSVIVRLLMPTNVADTQCGIKMFSHSLAVAVGSMSRVDRFAFDIEVFVIAATNNFLTESFPVELAHRRESSVRVVADTIYMLRDIFAIRARLMRGFYTLSHK